MATNAANRLIHHLRRAALAPGGAGQTDGELLELYANRRDAAAFEALVHRHGPMVLRVCRRVLRNQADAEDAFQATFLVLVRKAASIRCRNTVSNWLYGVAHNTALKAKAMNHKRQAKEREAGTVPKDEARAEVWREVQALLDAELSGFPEKYRVPIVLCDLEGKTIKEAARRLGWPQGTVATRLARGRARLAKRLTRRGLTLSGGVIAAALSQGEASAGVPWGLIDSTTRAASLIAAAGPAEACRVISTSVAELTERMVRSMSLTGLKVIVPLVLAGALIGGGTGVYQSRAGTSEVPGEVVKAPADDASAVAGSPKEDDKPVAGDPTDEEKINLPKGPTPVQVLARLDAGGNLVVKTAVPTVKRVGAPRPEPEVLSEDAVPGGGSGGAPARGKVVTTLRAQNYDLDDVRALDTEGKAIDKKALATLLKEETVAMAVFGGQSPDPLHLRVLKAGTLTFVLPAPKAGAKDNPDVVPPGESIPRPAPGVPADIAPDRRSPD
jgi:RNA polymerase sigma factor (sigma-70 family)